MASSRSYKIISNDRCAAGMIRFLPAFSALSVFQQIKKGIPAAALGRERSRSQNAL